MDKFKVGDTVRIKQNAPKCSGWRGRTGQIVRIFPAKAPGKKDVLKAPKYGVKVATSPKVQLYLGIHLERV